VHQTRKGNQWLFGLKAASASIAKRATSTRWPRPRPTATGFRILKRFFGFDKVRYRGIAKNHRRLCANFALVNLSLHRKRLAVFGQ
jgi:IS5 family transposase